MKYLSLFIFSLTLISTHLLTAQESQRTQCACKDCKCAVEAHCGCYSAKGCACGQQKEKISCCSGEKCKES